MYSSSTNIRRDRSRFFSFFGGEGELIPKPEVEIGIVMGRRVVPVEAWRAVKKTLTLSALQPHNDQLSVNNKSINLPNVLQMMHTVHWRKHVAGTTGRNALTVALNNKELSCRWVGRLYRIHPKATSGFWPQKSYFPEWQQCCLYTRYDDAAISNATINAGIRYGNSTHIMIAAGSNFAFKIAAKPLRKEIWLLPTA